MFHAVRQWWNGGRGKTTARLFAFEFVVVVAGVLMAQWVADRARQRSEIATMEQARSHMDRELSRGITNVMAWDVALPCLTAKLDAVMIAAGGTGIIAPDVLDRPGFRMFEVEPLSPDVALALIDRHGQQKATLYAGLHRRSMRISLLASQAAASWMELTVLDPRYGLVREGDRTNARAAASQIRSSLASIAIGARDYLEEARELGLKPMPIEGRRLPVDCRDIAASGSIMPYSDGKRL